MIHYAITLDRLIAAIDSELGTPARCDSWWSRAHADFKRAIVARTHDTGKAYWSEVKGAFIALQFNKCAYCEVPMPAGAKSRIAYDVEHHRPKSACSMWPNAATRSTLAIDYAVAKGRSRGYPELAHHPYNYAAACKVCNSPYKSDYFPIHGAADQDSYLIDELNRHELPSIPLPLGDWGEDPASFLTFDGFIAMPSAEDQATRMRAQVVIDFFELNRRPDLLLGRATAISMLYQHLKEVERPDLANDAAEAQRWADADMADSASHAGAARAFSALYAKNKPRAVRIARLANRYVSKKSLVLARQLTANPPAKASSMDEVLALLD